MEARTAKAGATNNDIIRHLHRYVMATKYQPECAEGQGKHKVERLPDLRSLGSSRPPRKTGMYHMCRRPSAGVDEEFVRMCNMCDVWMGARTAI